MKAKRLNLMKKLTGFDGGRRRETKMFVSFVSGHRKIVSLAFKAPGRETVDVFRRLQLN